MKHLNIITDIQPSSFYYATRYFLSWIDQSQFIVTLSKSIYVKGVINIYIGDMWSVFRYPIKADIYWIDTPLYYDDKYDKVPLQVYKPKHIWVTSRINQRQAHKYFTNVRIVPRPIHPIYMVTNMASDKKYDIAFIGDGNYKKGYDLFQKICREYNIRCFSTGSYTRIPLYDLVERLRRTRFLFWVSRSEGFGLPLLEAQSLGVPAICLKAHANIDYCYSAMLDPNLWVDVEKIWIEKDKEPRHRYFEPRINDLYRAVEYALNMSRSHYYVLSTRIQNRTRNMILNTIKWINSFLINY